MKLKELLGGEMKSLWILSILLGCRAALSVDLSIIGNIKFADGLGRIPIGLCSIFHDELSINHISSRHDIDLTDVSSSVISVLNNPDKTPGKVSILFYPLWWSKYKAVSLVPEESSIKIAYSMIETTQISSKAVTIFNTKFDAIVVPDEFYKTVYETSGVQIPIYVLPHGIFIEELLEQPLEQMPVTSLFTFGMSGQFCDRKNHRLLLEAFHAEFKDDPTVRLILHGRGGNEHCFTSLMKRAQELNVDNISVVQSRLTDAEYNELLHQFDCYVLPSKGEGFSVTPREALALGIPTIVSNNTAHQTICKTGFVYGIPSTVEQRAHFNNLGLGEFGNDFNCLQEDIQFALREVYNEYDVYKVRALQGRQWVRKYLWKNLKPYFRNLIKPKEVLLGKTNMLTKDYIMTNSKELYEKYLDIKKSDY